MVRILVVDNYDSFVYTIVGYLNQLGARTVVVRNDAVPAVGADGRFRDGDGVFDGVLVSPGPGTPEEAGQSEDVIRACAASGTPMLGVCLGHQALAEVYGATVTHAPELMHGKTSPVVHEDLGVLAGLPSPFTATRYHSLAVVPQTVPAELVVTATTENGVVMGLQHRDLPLHGVQFHPESVLTEGGHLLLANWLTVCGSLDAVERAQGLAPLVRL
ncbi:aminodeoxychorismate/anthranilate synthase component II [Oerskovia enterophila]|uniref:Aminodeoxychorismate synthase component 2 n=1 Tax=Oerskovia enterophila TaxID=43678 RepID=A0A163QIR5_9CELL|nr:aminodeoxychorismate/anthranilate synthase component II [Oerskovia enterophila]KZM34205.1 aminodeoxychorismate synthase component 2 [Oerskovia enterophila]OCI31462.1 aminodeoxychorismate synthase component 2 [Oerskovia enterophila]